MTQPEKPRDPASEREDRRDEDFAEAAQRLGLYTPLGPSQAEDDIRSAREAGGADAQADNHWSTDGPKIWPEDY